MAAMIIAAAPSLSASTITGLSSTSPAPLDRFTVLGTDLAAVTRVEMNGVAVPYYLSSSSLVIRTPVPQSVGQLDGTVKIYSPSGDATSAQSVTVSPVARTFASGFTWTSAGKFYVINGANLRGATQVDISGFADDVPFILVSDLRILIPLASFSDAANRTINVTTPQGNLSLSAGATTNIILLNGIAPGEVGHFDTLINSNEAGSSNCSGSYIGRDGVLWESFDLLFALRFFVDRGVAGSFSASSNPLGVGQLQSISTITQQRTLVGPGTVECKGSFSGSAGNIINWTVTGRLDEGSFYYTPTVVFTAASGTIGTLAFKSYIDQDINSLGDDFFTYTGTAATEDFTAFTIDGQEYFGFGQTTYFSPVTGFFENADYDGYAVGRFSSLQSRILAKTQVYSLTANPASDGTGNIHTDSGEAPQAPADPDFPNGRFAGTGGTDVSSSLSWTGNPTATYMIVTPFMRSVGSPVILAAELAGVLLPATIASGAGGTGTVALTAPAGAGGVTVTLSGNHANLVLPASVIVPAGQPSASFSFTAPTVATDTPVMVTATAGGIARIASTVVTAGATVPTEPEVTTGEFAGPVGTGGPISGAPPGTTFVQFTGTPALADGGITAYSSIIRNPDRTQSRAILSGNPPTILVRDSDDVSGMTSFSGMIPAGTKFYTFRDPLVNGAGRVAFMADLNHTTLVGNNARGFFTNVADGVMKLLMRIGAPDPDGRTYSNTGVITMAGNGVIFTATTTDGQKGLYGYDPVRGVETLFRTGSTVSSGGSNKVVQSFTMLATSGHLTGQGQEHTVNDATGDRFTSLVCAFTDGSQGVINAKFGVTAGNYSGFTETFAEKGRLVDFQAGALSALPLAEFTNGFKLPGRDQTGAFFGFIGAMQIGLAGVTGTTDTGIFLDADPDQLVLQVREGSAATGVSGATFKDFYTLMIGAGDYEYAFMADMRGTGLTGANDLGIWTKHGTAGMLLVAREGSEAPGVPAGNRFQNFNQMALPGEGHPILNATLAVGAGGVTGANDNGLWVMNSLGQLKLAVREGEVMNVGGSNRTVSTIQSLGSGNSSSVGSRIFTSDGLLKVLVGFSDGTQSYVQIAVP